MHVSPLSPLGIPRLGVNVDPVATVRETGGGRLPDPVAAALAAEAAGAGGISVHLREDRRHIQERDVRALRGLVDHLNVELALEPDVVRIAADVRPQAVCIVPECRAEPPSAAGPGTAAGLDCAADAERLADVVARLGECGSTVSVLIDPDVRQLQAARAAGAAAVELHTGRYAEARNPSAQRAALGALEMASEAAREIGLRVHAGYGLDYRNVLPVARIPGIEALNIGHAIIARAVFVGLDAAVREMVTVIERAVTARPYDAAGSED